MIADRLDWPIATPGDPQGRVTSPGYPSPWKIAVRFAQYYLLGGTSPAYHEADDLYIEGHADEGAPIYAIGNGTVIYSEVRSDSWDGLVVLEHEKPTGEKFYSRYGHMTGITVKKGDPVLNGTMIGHVGNARGRFGYHLHFGICITDAWLIKPWFWQKADRQWVLQNCVDPEPWIQSYRTISPTGGTEEEPMPEPNTTTVRVKTGGGNLNLRLSPGGNVVSTLREGTECLAFGDMLPAGGLMWQKVEVKTDHSTGWAAIKYLTTDPVVPVPPPPPPVKTGSRFGLNLLGNGAYNEVIGFIDRLAKVGEPLALAVVIDEGKMVQIIKQISPKTTVVFRSTAMPAGINITGSPTADIVAGRQFFNNYKGITTQGAGADYFQFCNEWLSYNDPKFLAGGVNAYLGLMEAAQEAGVKITVGDLNVGHPHPTLYNLLEPMLARAETLGFPFNYHAYTKPGTTDPNVDSANRAMLWKTLVKNHPKLKVVIGEYGPDDGNAAFPGSGAVVEMCRKYDTLLSGSQVIGYAYFGAAGSTGTWKQSDVTPALPDLEQWLKTF